MTELCGFLNKMTKRGCNLPASITITHGSWDYEINSCHVHQQFYPEDEEYIWSELPSDIPNITYKCGNCGFECHDLEEFENHVKKDNWSCWHKERGGYIDFTLKRHSCGRNYCLEEQAKL